MPPEAQGDSAAPRRPWYEGRSDAIAAVGLLVALASVIGALSAKIGSLENQVERNSWALDRLIDREAEHRDRIRALEGRLEKKAPRPMGLF